MKGPGDLYSHVDTPRANTETSTKPHQASKHLYLIWMVPQMENKVQRKRGGGMEALCFMTLQSLVLTRGLDAEKIFNPEPIAFKRTDIPPHSWSSLPLLLTLTVSQQKLRWSICRFGVEASQTYCLAGSHDCS